MKFIWFWLGGIYAIFLIVMTADVVTHKTSWRREAPVATIIAAALAVFGGLLSLFHWWVEQSGWGGVLIVIGLLYLAFALGCAFVGGVLRLFYRD